MGGVMSEQLVGTVTHYFRQPSVAVVHVDEGQLNVGDEIHVLGRTTDFTEKIFSMEVDHRKVEHAGVGEEIAIQVVARTRRHDQVFRIV